MIDTSNDRGKRDFAILQLFVQCGLRLFEVMNIDVVAWQHINLQGGYDFSEKTLQVRIFY